MRGACWASKSENPAATGLSLVEPGSPARIEDAVKKFTAVAAATALSLSLAGAPSASAQSAATELSSTSSGSSGASASSDKHNAPEGVDVPEPAQLGSDYTGSAPLSIGLAVAVIGLLGAILVNGVPVLTGMQLPDLQKAIADLLP